MHRLHEASFALSLAISLGSWSLAAATPLIEPHLGGTVLVGPTSPHPSSVFWNPAALAQSEFRGSHFFLSGNARLDRTTIDRASFDPGTGEPGRGIDYSSATRSTLSPGAMVAAVSDFATERYRFGFSLYTPFSESFLDGGDELAYHARGGYLRTQYATGSLAVRATGQFFFGVGVSFVANDLDLRWSRDRGLEACPTPPCEIEDPALAERIRIDAPLWRWHVLREQDLSLSFNAGVMFRMPRIPDLWIGAAYISFPTLGAGTILQTEGDSEVVGLEADGQTGYRLVGDARVGLRLPQMVHLGARYLVTEATHAVFAFRWIDFSRHKGLDVRISGPSPQSKEVPEVIPRYRGFHDVFSLEGGVEHTASDRLRTGAVLRLETSAVTPERLAPNQVDGPKADLGVGAELGLGSTVNLTVSYAFAIMLPQEVQDSVFSPSLAVACRESGYDLDTCAPARQGRAVPTAAGSYARLTHELVVGLEWQWF